MTSCRTSYGFRARQQLAAIIDRVRAEHVPVYLARRGRRVTAVIEADDLERILELAEDMADIRAAEAVATRLVGGAGGGEVLIQYR